MTDRSPAEAAPVAAGPFLSVVVPVFEEARVVEELVRRCVAAAEATGRPFELLVVDDASRDATPALLAPLAAADPRVVHLRLDANRGQFGATKEGLARARGALVAVLDGDLQDPPELLPRLVEAYESEPLGDASVVFAVKARREDPLWFRAGRAGYQALQSVLSARIPSGAGSYSLMPAALARRAAAVPLRSANLAAVLVALGARPRSVPYDKAARYDDHSRVGPVGLAKEALGSLALLSPAGARLLGAGPESTGRHGWGPLLAALAFVVPLLAVLASRLAERLGSALHDVVFANDDWEWLWFGQELGRFTGLLDPVGRDVLRPIAWAQYLVFPAIFGPEAAPIAVFQLLLGAAGSALLALVFRRVGFGWPAALVATAAAWVHPAIMESTQLISINEVTLSRTFAAALWLLFLRPVAPRPRVWVPLFVAGALSHESFIAVVPGLVLLVWTRDGLAGARALLRNRAVLAFAGTWAVAYAVRVVLYTTAPHNSHVLTAGALERNLLFLVHNLAGALAGPDDRPGELPFAGLLAAATVAALLLRGRYAPAAVALGAFVLLRSRFDPAPLSDLARLVALSAACLGVAALVHGRRLLRPAAFAFAFAALTYAPFLLQRDYVSWYFLHFAIHGATLLVGLMLPASFDAPPARALPAALALAVAILGWLPEPSVQRLFPDRLPERILDAVRAQLQPERDGATTVLFVEYGGVRSVQDGYIEMRSPWLPAIGSAFGWGPDGKALDVMNPVPAFDFSFPGRHFHTMVLDERHLRLACTRPDDVLVSVRERTDASEPGGYRGWLVAPLRPTLAAPDALPAALEPGTPEAARLEEELAAAAADPELASATLAGYRRFCDARRGADTPAADALARSTLALLHRFPGAARTGVAYDLRFVLKALAPEGLEDREGRLLPPRPDLAAAPREALRP
jgi:dolichol-phosphate mannosyltransferase